MQQKEWQVKAGMIPGLMCVLCCLFSKPFTPNGPHFPLLLRGLNHPYMSGQLIWHPSMILSVSSFPVLGNCCFSPITVDTVSYTSKGLWANAFESSISFIWMNVYPRLWFIFQISLISKMVISFTLWGRVAPSSLLSWLFVHNTFTYFLTVKGNYHSQNPDFQDGLQSSFSFDTSILRRVLLNTSFVQIKQGKCGHAW